MNVSGNNLRVRVTVKREGMSRFISKVDLAPFVLDEVACIQFLIDEGFLRTNMRCPMCYAHLQPKQHNNNRYPFFQCKSQNHRFTESVCTGTWFQHTKLPFSQILLLIHCFTMDLSYKQTTIDASVGDSLIANNTISDWFNNCRELCMMSMETKYKARGKLGGSGHIVEIEECQIGERRIRHGNFIEENWILGMIDISTNEVRIAVCPGNNRDASTLYNLISKHVEETSTIHTNAWSGYKGLMNGGFADHLAAKGSINLDKLNKNGQQRKTFRWRALHKRLSRGGIRKDKLVSHIYEYLWREDCANRQADPFQEFMENIRELFPC